MSALSQSNAIQAYAVKRGFDWDEVSQVLEKLREEVQEIEDAIAEGDAQHILEEMGDVLFCAVNVARKLGIDSEDALLRANKKFERRFSLVEQYAEQQGNMLEEMTLEEMEKLWQKAKQAEPK